MNSIQVVSKTISQSGQQLDLELSTSPFENGQSIFVIDLYLDSNPVHPEGHLGYLELKNPSETTFNLRITIKDSEVNFNLIDSETQAKKEVFVTKVPKQDVVRLNFFLRDKSERIVAQRSELASIVQSKFIEKKSYEDDFFKKRRAALQLPDGVQVEPEQNNLKNVHIYTVSLVEKDAIGEFILSQKVLFEKAGYKVHLYTRYTPPHLSASGIVKIITEVDIERIARKSDYFIFHYSVRDDMIERIANLSIKKIFYYHNVTPAHFFEGINDKAIQNCTIPAENIKSFFKFDLFVSASEYNNQQLRDMMKENNSEFFEKLESPFLKAPPFLGAIPNLAESVNTVEPKEAPQKGKFLLFVGRLAPNKGITQLIELFSKASENDEELSLVIVGNPQFPKYDQKIAQALDKIGEKRDRVLFRKGVWSSELKWFYKNAKAFVTMSEHEGYCVPLIEAMYHGCPIVIGKQDAMLEVTDGSALVIESLNNVDDLTALNQFLSSDTAQKELVSRGKQRFKEIYKNANGKLFLDSLSELSNKGEVKVVYNCSSVAFQDSWGGGEVQLLESLKNTRQEGEFAIEKFDQWNKQLKEADIYHHFSVTADTNVMNYVETNGLKIVCSPILWPTDHNNYDLDAIANFLNRADVICPNSEAEKNLLVELLKIPEEKFYVITNAVDSLFYKNLVPASLFREEFEITSDFVLNVANIEERKNQRQLAEACRALDLPLIVVGNIRNRDFAKHLLSDFPEVRWIGPLDHHSELLRSAYAACKVFALPSLCETPGLAALEAGCSGASILITNEGPTEEYFGEYAKYCDPRDLKSITESLQSAWENPSPGEMQSHIIDSFSWDVVKNKLRELYCKLS